MDKQIIIMFELVEWLEAEEANDRHGGPDHELTTVVIRRDWPMQAIPVEHRSIELFLNVMSTMSSRLRQPVVGYNAGIWGIELNKPHACVWDTEKGIEWACDIAIENGNSVVRVHKYVVAGYDRV